MGWGVQEADKRGVDAYVDATDQGRPLYAKYGFVADAPREFTLEKLPNTPRRKDLEEQLIPFTWWPMYRFARGTNDTDTGKLPWEKGA